MELCKIHGTAGYWLTAVGLENTASDLMLIRLIIYMEAAQISTVTNTGVLIQFYLCSDEVGLGPLYLRIITFLGFSCRHRAGVPSAGEPPDGSTVPVYKHVDLDPVECLCP